MTAGETALLRLLLTFPPHETDETEPLDERRERLGRLAVAIEQTTEDLNERAMLVSLGWYESRFAGDVQRCERLGDGGKAKGLFQSWSLKCPADELTQVENALRHLQRAGNWCAARREDYFRGAFSLFATGGPSCRWPGAPRRVRLMWRVRGML